MGLKRLISRLDSGESFGSTYPNHNTPDNVGGFNYGQSISIFDTNLTNNDYFPFKQRSMGYGPQGTKDSTGMFGRLHGPAPYQKQNLPDLDPNKLGPGDTGPILGVVGAIDAITDVGVRGGLVTALKRSAIDAARIGEFLLSAKGLGFIAKNVGLQRTNPKLQEGAGFLGRNRVYNLGVNTLAQTLANFSGLHITRQGALPIGRANYKVEQGYRVDSDNDTKYEYNVRGVNPELTALGTGNITNSTSVYKGNRLASLYNKHVKGDSSSTATFFAGLENPELYEFSGGPHSIYGIGKTRLKRYVYTGRDTLRALIAIKKQRKGYNESRHRGSKNGPTGNGNIIDFRKNKGVPYTPYDQKIGEGGQSLDAYYGFARGRARSGGGNRIPTNQDNTINVRASHPLADRINSTDIWTHEGPWDTTDLGSQVKDFIKFRIEAVNTEKPTQSDTMVFRAFLDSMDDSYSSKWNEYNYNGRAEPFYTFGSFNRGISFSFKVAAFTRDDMRPMYRKLNYLVSQTAGEYSNTRLRGNFCRLTIGDYHSRLPGFFTSINLKWNKDYPWEIAMYQKGIGSKAKLSGKTHTDRPTDQLIGGREQMLLDSAEDRELKKLEEQAGGTGRTGAEGVGGRGTDENPLQIDPVNVVAGRQTDMDTDMLELPHILDVSCNFQPVHDFIPQKSIQKSPFILPTKYSKPDLHTHQDWLKWGPISEEERQKSKDAAKAEEEQIEADFKAAEEERERREEEERKRALEEMTKQLEADVAADLEEEEIAIPEPWENDIGAEDLPTNPGNVV